MYSRLEAAILGMSSSDYGVMSAFIAGLLMFLVYYTFGAFRRFRIMDATATSKIRSAAQGHVELKGLGELMPGDSIQSPFSGRRCLWYHCTIDKKQRRGKRTTWTNISDEISHHLFQIVDETGECIVDPDDAYVVPEIDQTWYGNGPERRNYPPKRGKLVAIGLGGYRFRERLILPATQIYALGWFHTIHSEQATQAVAGEVESLVRDWKLQPARHLAEYDLDANGKIQKDEWKAVRSAARNQVLARIRNQKKEHHLLRKPSDGRLPFLISTESEESLAGRKKLAAYASLCTAFALFSALVVMYSIRPLLSV